MTHYCLNPECKNSAENDGHLCPPCAKKFKSVDTSDPSPWMQTVSGRRYDFFRPDVNQIDINDIAWALSRKSRFNGHTKNTIPYSVAQHCCFVYDRVCEEFEDPDIRLWALLHDAAEAYLPDVHTQLKDHLPGFRELEQIAENAIADRFGLGVKFPCIKKIDHRTMATERRDQMVCTTHSWGWLDKVEPYQGVIIRAAHSEDAYAMFLLRFQRINARRAA